jgi:hypothetical protein
LYRRLSRKKDDGLPTTRGYPIDVGWSEAVGVWLNVEGGRPVANIYAEQGDRLEVAVAFLPMPSAFLFFVSEKPLLIGLNGLLQMIREGEVTFGLFIAELKDEAEFFPVYNWLRRMLRTGKWTMRFFIVGPVKDPMKQTKTAELLSSFEDTVTLNRTMKTIYASMVKRIEEKYRDRLVGFKEEGESSIRLRLAGPSYLLPED